jgi:hypothetical protein
MSASYADRSHSYQGQDLFVLEILGSLRSGYFLDSRASAGIRGSNTRLLEASFGWRGVCVEPDAALFRELVGNRGCICVQCCLDDRVGFAIRVPADRWPSGAVPPTAQQEIRTVGSVLREAAAPSVIDYWSLDTDGSALSILKSFPFEEYRFRVLTVKHNDGPARGDIRRFLESRGYARVRLLGGDDGYVGTGELPSYTRRGGVWRGRRGRA